MTHPVYTEIQDIQMRWFCPKCAYRNHDYIFTGGDPVCHNDDCDTGFTWSEVLDKKIIKWLEKHFGEWF